MIRVLRLLEYVYESAEIAEQDMARWGVPAIGSAPISLSTGKQIRSTILTNLNWEPESEDGN